MFRRNFILTAIGSVILPWWPWSKRTCPICGIDLALERGPLPVKLGDAMALCDHLVLCRLSPAERAQKLAAEKKLFAVLAHVQDDLIRRGR